MNNWTPDSVIHVTIDWPALRKQWPEGLRSFNLTISQPSDDTIEIASFVRVQVDSGTVSEYNVGPELRFEEIDN